MYITSCNIKAVVPYEPHWRWRKLDTQICFLCEQKYCLRSIPHSACLGITFLFPEFASLYLKNLGLNEGVKE